MRLNPKIPAEMERIINKALEKDRNLRFQSAAEMRADLQRLKRDADSSRSAVTISAASSEISSVSDTGTHSSSSASEVVPKTSRPAWKTWAAAIGGIALLVIGALVYLQSRPLPQPKVSGYVPITHDGNQKWIVGTDGARLFLGEFGAGSRIGQVASSGGDVAPVAAPSPTMVPLAVSPDGSTLLVADEVGQTAFHGPLWALPVLGGSPRRLGDTAGQAAAWSPDGQKIVYGDGHDLVVANSDGSAPTKLFSAPDDVLDVAWSPDGSLIRFSSGARNSSLRSLWQVSVTGKDPGPLLPGWNPPSAECCGRWTSDGKYFVFQSRKNIWARAENRSWFGKTDSQPFQLTSGPMNFSSPLPSNDGKKLFVVGTLPRGELTGYDTKSGNFSAFLSGISADGVSFSKDGQWVAYVSYPDSTLWKSKADGSQRIQLTYPPLTPVMPRWSPDGKQIVFFAFVSGKKTNAYMVSAEGGTPRDVMPEDTQDEWDPTWSADGTKIAFGGGATIADSSIRLFDLKTNQVSTLPGSKGLFSPRWSPDGRYIAALSFESRGLMLFDVARQTWEEIAKISLGFPNWSKNGDYIYFLHEENEPSVMRVRLSDHKVERIADLKGFRQAGYFSIWLGLAPDDSPLLLRDTGTQEIYALDWQAQ